MSKIFIFYFRFFLAWIWFCISFFIGCILVIFRWKNPDTSHVIAKIISFGTKNFLGLNIQVENKHLLYSTKPCIIVANHQSNLDIFTFPIIYPKNCVLIAKKELILVPFFNFFLIGAGHLFLDRKNKNKATSSLKKLVKKITKNKLSVWIFPEGHRNYGSTKLLPFKKGAFYLAIDSGYPILPIAHENLKNYYDSKKFFIETKKPIKIKILDPINTQGLTYQDIDSLMEKTKSLIEAEVLKISNM
jgi:1-acyl-sn-glycerol-3-phosphate acyltransferase